MESFFLLLGILSVSQMACAKTETPTELAAHNDELKTQLRIYLESNELTTRSAELTEIIAKVVAIQSRLVPLMQEGQVEEAQLCAAELQVELRKVYEIKKSDAEVWKGEQLSQGRSLEVIQAVVEEVLQEYRERWNLS